MQYHGVQDIALGSLLLTASVIVFPVTYAISDLIADVYGYQIARSVIWSGTACVLIFGLLTDGLMHLHSPHSWRFAEAYQELVMPQLRIAFGYMVATTAGTLLNAYMIVRWKALVHGRHFWLRSIGSTLVGEAVFTVLVSVIFLFHIFSNFYMVKIMLSLYIVKVVYACFAAGPISIIAAWLKNAEGLSDDLVQFDADQSLV